MKKNFPMFIAISLLLFSCQHAADKKATKDSVMTATVKANKPIVAYKNALLKAYVTSVDSLGLDSAGNSSIAAEKYKKLFSSSPVEIRDSAFVIFDKFYEKLSLKLDDSPEKEAMDLDKYYAYKNSEKPTEKVATYVNRLKQNGFELREEEGSMYIVEDRDFLALRFYSLVSPVAKQYLVQLNKENKEIYAEDASIIIGYKELVDRAIWWEHFTKAQPLFIYQKQARATKINYLELLLEGMDNSWVVDPDTKKLQDYFRKAYTYLEREYPLSETGKIVIPYFHLLADGKKGQADSLLKDYEAKGIIDKAILPD